MNLKILPVIVSAIIGVMLIIAVAVLVPQYITVEKLTPEEKWLQKMRKEGPFISEILEIEHPALDQPAQQSYFHNLSDEEAQRAKQIILDAIRDAEKIVVTLHWWGEKGADSREFEVPGDRLKEAMLDSFDFEHPYVPPLHAVSDIPMIEVTIYPSTIRFVFFFIVDDLEKTQFWITGGNNQQVLKGKYSTEFIEKTLRTPLRENGPTLWDQRFKEKLHY